MYCRYAMALLLALAAVVEADEPLGLGGLLYAPGHASPDYYAYPSYAFEYAVKDPHTGDNKAQWEKRDGDTVKGAYSLVEPDGSIRVVEYWADDKSGFNAVVKRLGPNLHPTGPIAAPIYKAPIPTLEHSGPLAPIAIGPVAKYEGLAAAPFLTGPHLGAISTASLVKGTPTPIKPQAAEPILPVIKETPYPIPLPLPIAKPGPYYTNPVPHNAPLLPASYVPYKSPIPYPVAPFGDYLYKRPLAAPISDHGFLGKAPFLPYLGNPLPYLPYQYKY